MSAIQPAPCAADRAGTLTKALTVVREQSRALAAPLSPEDCQIQSMSDASPTKWHLAHTTWFFETFVLKPYLPGYRAFDDGFAHLYNSYYNSVGSMHPRPLRGMVTRPTLATVLDYRDHVDRHLARLLDEDALPAALADLVTLGLHHEQQHQELLLTDIKHAFSLNPTAPAYRADDRLPPSPERALEWIDFDPGIVEIGAPAHGFAFDNERPRHRTLLQPFALANRPVTNAEFRAFVEDGSYGQPTLWLSDGWATIQSEGWQRPLYWTNDLAHAFSLHGLQPLDPHAPACHLSYFEADAYARWAGARLPREGEWEHAAEGHAVRGHFVESGVLQPVADQGSMRSVTRLQQLFGSVWEWTQSPYVGYPGYRPPAGAVGEYNGKFMCNQWVLRGGSCASSADHLRSSYRNFFPPQARWQFTGLRLARDL